MRYDPGTIMVAGREIPVMFICRTSKSITVRYVDEHFEVGYPQFIGLEKAEDYFYHHLDQKKLVEWVSAAAVKIKYPLFYLFGEVCEWQPQPDGTILVSHHEDHTRAYTLSEVPLEYFLAARLKSYLDWKIPQYYQAGLMPQYPLVEIKKMRNAWGKCYPLKNKLAFNTRLVHEPRGAIDSVIIHEIGHFHSRRHDASFYQWVKSHYPDYEKWDVFLKKGGVSL